MNCNPTGRPSRVKPVSYTHLDVYKRQAVPSAALAFVQQTRSMAYSFQALAQTGAMLIGGSNGPAGLPYVVVQGSGSP